MVTLEIRAHKGHAEPFSAVFAPYGNDSAKPSDSLKNQKQSVRYSQRFPYLSYQ